MSRRNEWEEWEGSDQVTEAVEKGREHAEKTSGKNGRGVTR